MSTRLDYQNDELEIEDNLALWNHRWVFDTRCLENSPKKLLKVATAHDKMLTSCRVKSV